MATKLVVLQSCGVALGGNPCSVRCFMAVSDYYFGYSDSDDEGTYDPARKCFNIELGMPSTSDEDEGVGNRSPPHEGAGDATPPHVEPLAAQNENPALEELRRLDLEQLHELQAKVEQDRLLLQQLRDTLEQDQWGHGDGRAARRRAHDVNHRINNDIGGEQPPIFNRTSQNVMAAVMLLRTMPEPSTSGGRRVHGELQDLLKTAAV